MTNSNISPNPELGTRRLLAIRGGTTNATSEDKPPIRHNWLSCGRDGNSRYQLGHVKAELLAGK